MSQLIPEKFQALLNAPITVTLVTVMPDGQPQATPVWCSFDGENILINTAAGRQKDRNMLANPKVAISLINPENPYEWLEVRGEAFGRTAEGGVDHIDHLARVYTGREQYYDGQTDPNSETRVIFKVKPTKVNASG